MHVNLASSNGVFKSHDEQRIKENNKGWKGGNLNIGGPVIGRLHSSRWIVVIRKSTAL